MGDIWRYKLDDLSSKLGNAEAERKELKAAYKYLTQVVRNRDAHSYVANQRRKDLLAVEPIFHASIQQARAGHEGQRALQDDWR